MLKLVLETALSHHHRLFHMSMSDKQDLTKGLAKVRSQNMSFVHMKILQRAVYYISLCLKRPIVYVPRRLGLFSAFQAK